MAIFLFFGATSQNVAIINLHIFNLVHTWLSRYVPCFLSSISYSSKSLCMKTNMCLWSANKLSKTVLTNAHTGWLLYQCSTHLLRSANKLSKTMLTNAHTGWSLYQCSTHLLRSANKLSKTMLTNAHTGWLLYQYSTHLLRSANKFSKTMLTNTTQIDYCTNARLISLDLQIKSLRLC